MIYIAIYDLERLRLNGWTWTVATALVDTFM